MLKFWPTPVFQAADPPATGPGAGGEPSPAPPTTVAPAVDPTVSDPPKETPAPEPSKDDKSKSMLSADDDEKKEAPQAPVDFDPKTFKAPEGVEIAQETLGEFAKIINNKDLSRADLGNALLKMHSEALEAIAKAPYESFNNIRENWQKQVNSDKEIGTNFKETKTVVSRALDKVFENAPEHKQAFYDALDITGVGDNPAVIRALYRMGKLIAEPGPAGGAKPPGQQPESLAEAMYPHLAKGNG